MNKLLKTISITFSLHFSTALFQKFHTQKQIFQKFLETPNIVYTIL